jgi:antitoxin (DNA-binding transcriptional repressor) of toxin-antitoxin stability system
MPVVDESPKPAVAHRRAHSNTRHDVLSADRPDDGHPLNDRPISIGNHTRLPMTFHNAFPRQPITRLGCRSPRAAAPTTRQRPSRVPTTPSKTNPLPRASPVPPAACPDRPPRRPFPFSPSLFCLPTLLSPPPPPSSPTAPRPLRPSTNCYLCRALTPPEHLYGGWAGSGPGTGRKPPYQPRVGVDDASTPQSTSQSAGALLGVPEQPWRCSWSDLAVAPAPQQRRHVLRRAQAGEEFTITVVGHPWRKSAPPVGASERPSWPRCGTRRRRGRSTRVRGPLRRRRRPGMRAVLDTAHRRRSGALERATTPRSWPSFNFGVLVHAITTSAAARNSPAPRDWNIRAQRVRADAERACRAASGALTR